MVPISHLRSPTSQPQTIGLLLQLESIPYCRCPPPGSGFAATTGTTDLTATATGSSIDNRCGEHGPLGRFLFYIQNTNTAHDTEHVIPIVKGAGSSIMLWG
ncbi:hypothetical protein GOODEAATRI_013381 [Goodea atripinnis]|uniref:Uncharacterized protein n=1 Tax=Goodea atripinnis TaxID=208336 RepID=A0ABV0PY61_9TELE